MKTLFLTFLTLSATSFGTNFKDIKMNVLGPACMKCHSGFSPKAGVNVSSYFELMNSNVIVAGDPDNSRLYTVIASGKMPKNANMLSQEQIDLVRQWIQDGAPDLTYWESQE